MNGVKASMTNALHLFFEFLFWTNEREVPNFIPTKQDFSTLHIKPINLTERIFFILSKLEHYHSFIQLSQLFDEFTKQYYKKILMDKQKK